MGKFRILPTDRNNIIADVGKVFYRELAIEPIAPGIVRVSRNQKTKPKIGSARSVVHIDSSHVSISRRGQCADSLVRLIDNWPRRKRRGASDAGKP